MATYESNHILGSIKTYRHMRAGQFIESKDCKKLYSMLEVNKNSSSPAAAARQKIITTHFRDANVKQFLDMDEEVYPHVIAWMAKDKDGLSLLSAFLCGISGCIGDWQKAAKEEPTRSSTDMKQLLDSVDEEITSKLASIDIGSSETKLPKRFYGKSETQQISIIFSEGCKRRIPSAITSSLIKKILKEEEEGTAETSSQA